MTGICKWAVWGIAIVVLCACANSSTLTPPDDISHQYQKPVSENTEIPTPGAVAPGFPSVTYTAQARSSGAAQPVSPISPISPVTPPDETPIPTTLSTSSGAADQIAYVVVPESSSVIYSVEETLLAENSGRVTVTGSTSQISGQVQLNRTDPTQSVFGTMFVRVLSMRSDSPERDQSLLDQWPDMRQYPFATFQATEVRHFPEAFELGQPIHFELVGTLNLKSVARQVIWDTTATLLGNQITGTAVTTLSLSDYDIPVPSVPGVRQGSNQVTVTVNFTLQEAKTLPEKPST
jgi:polyisoprenoid-binding protein YceI